MLWHVLAMQAVGKESTVTTSIRVRLELVLADRVRRHRRPHHHSGATKSRGCIQSPNSPRHRCALAAGLQRRPSLQQGPSEAMPAVVESTTGSSDADPASILRQSKFAGYAPRRSILFTGSPLLVDTLGAGAGSGPHSPRSSVVVTTSAAGHNKTDSVASVADSDKDELQRRQLTDSVRGKVLANATTFTVPHPPSTPKPLRSSDDKAEMSHESNPAEDAKQLQSFATRRPVAPSVQRPRSG